MPRMQNQDPIQGPPVANPEMQGPPTADQAKKTASNTGTQKLSDPKTQDAVRNAAQQESLIATRELAQSLAEIANVRTMASSAALADAQAKMAHQQARVSEFEATDYISRMNEQRAREGLPAIRDVTPGGPAANMAAFADSMNAYDPIQAKLLGEIMQNLDAAQKERKPTGGILSTIFGQGMNLFGDTPTAQERLAMVLQAAQTAQGIIQPNKDNKVKTFDTLANRDIAAVAQNAQGEKEVRDMMQQVASDFTSGKTELAMMKLQVYKDSREQYYRLIGMDNEAAMAQAKMDADQALGWAGIGVQRGGLAVQERANDLRAQEISDQATHWSAQVDAKLQELRQKAASGDKKFASQANFDMELDTSLEAIRAMLSDTTGKSPLLSGTTLSDEVVQVAVTQPAVIEALAQNNGVSPVEIQGAMIAQAAQSYIGDIDASRGQVSEDRLVKSLDAIIANLDQQAAAKNEPGSVMGIPQKPMLGQVKAYATAAKNLKLVRDEVVAQLNARRIEVELVKQRGALNSLIEDKPYETYVPGFSDVKEVGRTKMVRPSEKFGKNYQSKIDETKQLIASLEKELSKIRTASLLNRLTPEPSAGEKQK